MNEIWGLRVWRLRSSGLAFVHFCISSSRAGWLNLVHNAESCLSPRWCSYDPSTQSCVCVCPFSCVFVFSVNLPEIIRRLCCSLPNRLFRNTVEGIGCMAAGRRKWLFPLLSIHRDISGILRPLDTQDTVDIVIC